MSFFNASLAAAGGEKLLLFAYTACTGESYEKKRFKRPVAESKDIMTNSRADHVGLVGPGVRISPAPRTYVFNDRTKWQRSSKGSVRPDARHCHRVPAETGAMLQHISYFSTQSRPSTGAAEKRFTALRATEQGTTRFAFSSSWGRQPIELASC